MHNVKTFKALEKVNCTKLEIINQQLKVFQIEIHNIELNEQLHKHSH